MNDECSLVGWNEYNERIPALGFARLTPAYFTFWKPWRFKTIP